MCARTILKGWNQLTVFPLLLILYINKIKTSFQGLGACLGIHTS